MSSFYHILIQIDNKSEYQSKVSSGPQSPLTFPRSLFDKLPSHSAAPISKRRDTLPSASKKDYRFGPIRIDWIDFKEMGSTNASNGTQAAKGRQSEEWQTPAAIFIPGLPSGTANLPEGVVHIFRERPSQGSRPIASTSSAAEPSTSSAGLASPSEPKSSSTLGQAATTVAVLAVPPWMTPADFLAFVAPAAEGMKHLRLIRDVSPNRTMVIIQFREASNATEFIEEFNGKQFNSIEPETCSIVRVQSVEIDTDDPISHTINRGSANSSSVYELPTCPVCLDRMDAKWGDSRCPVCRYSQIALSSASQSASGFPYPPPPSGSRLVSCTDCDSRLNLWICLICGNVGCGRQGRAHAKGHFDLTSHCYAMELSTQRVWDYAGDNYVHRLIQNKADGKLVELPPAAGVEEGQGRNRQGQGPGEDDNLKAEKMEILAMQYSQILQRAMEDQRVAYDEQMVELRRKLEDAQRKVEIMSEDTERKVREAHEELQRRRAEDEERQAHLERERIKAEKKAEKMAELARRLEKELKEERTVSEGLMNNITSVKGNMDVIKKEKDELSSKVSDLEEQMRDLMFFLEARDKIEQGGGAISEAAGGSIELPESPPNKVVTGGKKKKKR
ncbi:BRCA1-associated protein [Sanghuangporus baumii]|uniref:BRCA1-associated protein n=1 Tax=Sanghuangporus baumii TaxID=108892 RepID=A0A9Q5I1J8_SANBA|nr:BRCA1-associated protein [Sanghuangporus baumii]